MPIQLTATGVAQGQPGDPPVLQLVFNSPTLDLGTVDGNEVVEFIGENQSNVDTRAPFTVLVETDTGADPADPWEPAPDLVTQEFKYYWNGNAKTADPVIPASGIGGVSTLSIKGTITLYPQQGGPGETGPDVNVRVTIDVADPVQE